MELTNEFTVAAPVEAAWELLLDIERLGPCMPGAEVTSFDGEAFTGTVKVKLGPVNLTYAGKGRFVSRDAEARQVVIEASGKDKRGSGNASATVTGTLHPEGPSTRVHVVTTLHITGPPAQFGRGMIADVSQRLIGQFAACLADELAQAPAAEAPAAAPEESAEPPAVETPVAAPIEAVEEPAPVPVVESAPAEKPTVQPMAVESPAEKPKREVEPIDLLAVTGAKSRVVPYTVAFLLGAVVGALIMALIL